MNYISKLPLQSFLIVYLIIFVGVTVLIPVTNNLDNGDPNRENYARLIISFMVYFYTITIIFLIWLGLKWKVKTQKVPST